MSCYEIDQIRQTIKEVLDEKRYEHTLGVMYTAAALAMRYEEDVKKALVAGLLHDCAKPVSTNLMHAKVGAQFAKEKYNVNDSYILDAICYHTTGRPNMTLLDKIIYIADYIEPHRNKASNLESVRHMAFVDIDKCLYMILEATLDYLKTTCKDIDPLTEQTYIYYKERI